MNFKNVFLIFATGLLIWGCASPQRRAEKKVLERELLPPEITERGRVLRTAPKSFLQAEKAFRQRKYPTAKKLYQETRLTYPEGRIGMISTYRLGAIYYYTGLYKAARREFEYLLNRYPKSEITLEVKYNLAAAEYQLGNLEDSFNVLSSVSESKVLKSKNKKQGRLVYDLMARVARELEDPAGVVYANSKLMELPLNEAARQKAERSVDIHLARILDREQLETLLREVGEPTVQSKIVARMSTLTHGGFDSNLAFGQMLESEVKGLGRGSVADRSHIGVILPLTGKRAAYGKRALEAILLASDVYSSRGSNTRLFIRDTASNTANARNAVDELVSEHDVVAIIGPLHWQESLAVAKRAQELQVVNLSLAVREGISASGAYLFQNALTARIQLDSLVRYCIQKKGLLRFGILAPDDAFGKDMTNHFWDLVEKYGGKVSAYESYPAKAVDFQLPIKRLVDLDQPELRKEEWEKVQAYLEEQKERGVRNPKARLPPIIDFDALFIPDSVRMVAQIAPSLAYLDVTGIPLLGTIQWQGEQLKKRAGRYAEGALFPTGLPLESESYSQNKFIRVYEEAYGSRPDLLAAQAYEAMSLIIEGVGDMNSNDRNALVYSLRRLKDYESPLGKLTFDSTRLAQRELSILSMGKRGAVLEYSPF